MTPTHYNRNFLQFSLCTLAAAIFLGISNATAFMDREIEEARYTCIQFVSNQLRESLHSDLDRVERAQFWIVAYINGIYEARELATFGTSDVTAENNIMVRVKKMCRQNLDATVKSVARVTGESPKPLPETPGLGFNPMEYSCKDYVAEKSGERARAETSLLADFWAFAFVQGYLAPRSRKLYLPIKNKKTIANAIQLQCSNNPYRSFYDQTLQVASVVRPVFRRRP